MLACWLVLEPVEVVPICWLVLDPVEVVPICWLAPVEEVVVADVAEFEIIQSPIVLSKL